MANNTSTFTEEYGYMIDHFDELQDMRYSDLQYLEEYRTLKMKQNDGQAVDEVRLQQLENMFKNKIITSARWNKFQNALIGMQTFIKNEVEGYVLDKQQEMNDFTNQTKIEFRADIDRFAYRNEYDNTVQYYVLNMVTFEGETYICIQDSLNNNPLNMEYWRKVSRRGDKGDPGIGLRFQGEYDNEYAYNVNDAVLYNGNIYYCTSPSIGRLPTENTHWGVFFELGDYAIPITEKGQAGGVASLGENGNVPDSQLGQIPQKVNYANQELQSNQITHETLYRGINTVESDRNTILKVENLEGRHVINLVPLFNSGAWTFHENVVVNSPNKITHTNTSAGEIEFNYIKIATKTNTEYILTMRHNGLVAVYDGTGSTPIVSYTTDQSIIFNSNSNNEIRIYLRTIEEATYTFENVMLNEGLESHEFVADIKPIRHPTIVSRGKNLFDINKFVYENSSNYIKYNENSIKAKGTDSRYWDTIPMIKFSPNTTYTISVEPLTTDIQTNNSSQSNGFSGTGVVTFATDNEGLQGFKFDAPNSNDTVISNIQIELGSQSTSYEPYTESQITLKSSFYGDESIKDTIFQGENGDWYKKKQWNHVDLDSDLDWTYSTSGTGWKRVAVSDFFTNKVDGGNYLNAVKFNGKLLKNVSSSPIEGDAIHDNTSMLILTISESDSGWGDNYTPTKDEIKAYFKGWKMLPSGQPRTASYNGSGEKMWYPTTEINASDYPWDASRSRKIVPDNEYANGDNWKPYQLIYQLSKPMDELIEHDGVLQLYEGLNQIQVGESLIVNEIATPYQEVTNTVINKTSLPTSLLKSHAIKILEIIKNGRVDNQWNIGISGSTSSYRGGVYAYIKNEDFDLTATYTVKYIAHPYQLTSRLNSVRFNYPNNFGSTLDAIVDDVSILKSKTISHSNDESRHNIPLIPYKSQKDSSGTFTRTELRREDDNTLYSIQTLSEPNSDGKYTQFTEKRYDRSGREIIEVKHYNLIYDNDGDLIGGDIVYG